MRAWAVLLVSAAAAAALAGCAASDDRPALPLGRSVAATAALSPTTHLFGDTVQASVDVVVDRERFDPGRLRLAATFAPYEPVEPVAVERKDHGRYTRLRYTATLRCLDQRCLTGAVSPGITAAGQQPELRRAERHFTFRAGHVYYDVPGRRRPRHLRRVYWPRLETLSRVGPRDPSLTFAFTTPFRSTLRPLPELSYRLPPAAAAAGLLAGAALLLTVPAGLAVGWYRRRRPDTAVTDAPTLTPLERALALAERALASGDTVARREALEALAFELDALGRREHAAAARRVAWSAPAPTADATAAVIASVREGTDA